jgi:hypothetical protein
MVSMNVNEMLRDGLFRFVAGNVSLGPEGELIVTDGRFLHTTNDWQPHESPARTEYVVSLERKLAAAEKERDEARAQLENALDASKDGAWMARALDAERNSASQLQTALANSDACWRMEEAVIVRQRDDARAEVARLNAQLESITAENHARAQREALSLEDWANLRAQLDQWKLYAEEIGLQAVTDASETYKVVVGERDLAEQKVSRLQAEIEMLRGVGCREAKAGEPESGPCGVCLLCAEERGARWALERHGNPFASKTLEQYAEEICRDARGKQ